MSLNNAFYQFPNFPEEIRRQIWKLSLSSRIIHIRLHHWDRVNDRPKAKFSGQKPPLYKAPHVAQLLVCRESQSEVLPLYEPFKNSPSFQAPKGSWINPDIDVVYCDDILFDEWWCGQKPNYIQTRYCFPDHYSLSRIAFDASAVHFIVRLALPLDAFRMIFDVRLSHMDDIVPVFKKYKSLKEVILADGQHSDWSGTGRNVQVDDIGVWEEGYVPVLQEAHKWKFSSQKGRDVMTGGYMQVSVVIARLKNAESKDGEGWKAPEIKYMKIAKV